MTHVEPRWMNTDTRFSAGISKPLGHLQAKGNARASCRQSQAAERDHGDCQFGRSPNVARDPWKAGCSCVKPKGCSPGAQFVLEALRGFSTGAWRKKAAGRQIRWRRSFQADEKAIRRVSAGAMTKRTPSSCSTWPVAGRSWDKMTDSPAKRKVKPLPKLSDATSRRWNGSGANGPDLQTLAVDRAAQGRTGFADFGGN